jgi:hypothetical protein
MVDVFISYLRNDQAIVAMLARALEAGGCAGVVGRRAAAAPVL